VQLHELKDELIKNSLVANFLQYMSAENNENRLTHVKDIGDDKEIFYCRQLSGRASCYTEASIIIAGRYTL